MSDFGNMSSDEVRNVKSRLIEQIQAMSDAEIAIAAKSKESLAFYIAGAFQALAGAIGYIIALPIAFAGKIAESMYTGFKRGFAGGFRAAGYEI